jgi:hypothetical protein
MGLGVETRGVRGQQKYVLRTDVMYRTPGG